MPQINDSISKRVFVDNNIDSNIEQSDACVIIKTETNLSDDCDKINEIKSPSGNKTNTTYLCHRCRSIFSSRAVFEFHYK